MYVWLYDITHVMDGILFKIEYAVHCVTRTVNKNACYTFMLFYITSYIIIAIAIAS